MDPATREADSGWMVGPSWASVHAAYLSMKPLFISAAGAMLLVAVFQFYAPGWFGAGSRAMSLLVQFLISMAALFLRLLISAPVAVAVHRFVLLGERTEGAISLRPSHTRRFALWLCVFSLIAFLVIGVAFSFNFVFGSFRKVLFIVILIVTFMVSVFSALIFPAIAIEEPSSGWRELLSSSWRRMKGHFWLFVGTSIAAFLPIFLLILVVAGTLGAAEAILFKDASGRNLLGLAIQVFLHLSQIYSAMLGASIASHFYARFRDQRSAI